MMLRALALWSALLATGASPVAAAWLENQHQCGTTTDGSHGSVDGNLLTGNQRQASMQLFTDSAETRRYIGEIHTANVAETIPTGSGDILAKIRAIADRSIESSKGAMYPMMTNPTGGFSCGALPFGNYDLVAMYFVRDKKRFYSVHSVAQFTLTPQRPTAHLGPKSFREISRR